MLPSLLSLSRLGKCVTLTGPHLCRISTTACTQATWENEIRKKAHWLDTSRNVEKEEANSEDKVVLSADGRVVVAWHPEVSFPYEFTKPLPADVTPTDSNLKIQALLPTREFFRPKHKRLVVRELMQLTYTSKYRWLCPPTRRERYRKMDVLGLNEKRDREGL